MVARWAPVSASVGVAVGAAVVLGNIRGDMSGLPNEYGSNQDRAIPLAVELHPGSGNLAPLYATIARPWSPVGATVGVAVGAAVCLSERRGFHIPAVRSSSGLIANSMASIRLPRVQALSDGMESYSNCGVRLNSALSVRARSNKEPSTVHTSANTLPLWIGSIASPPSSTSES